VDGLAMNSFVGWPTIIPMWIQHRNRCLTVNVGNLVLSKDSEEVLYLKKIVSFMANNSFLGSFYLSRAAHGPRGGPSSRVGLPTAAPARETPVCAFLQTLSATASKIGSRIFSGISCCFCYLIFDRAFWNQTYLSCKRTDIATISGRRP
jgi:hypothetical protein